MEAADRNARALPLDRFRPDLGSCAAFAVPYLLLLYLSLRNGGYGVTERSEVGIALWWLILVGTAAGALSLARGRAARATTIALGLLAAFAAWTALSLLWSGSEERTFVEVGRVVAYLAVFVIAITEQASSRWRAILWGVTAAAATVVGLAALSRMFLTEFPAQNTGEILTGAELERRLAYPLNYSSGLAAFAAVTVPLLLRAAAEARLIAVQAVSAGLLPICVLVLWLTGSSLAIPFLAVGLLAYLLLTADRLPQLLTVTAAGIGGAVLVAAADQRAALDRGLVSDAATEQGRELFAIALVVIVGVALVHAAVGLAARHAGRPGWLTISRRQAGLAAAAVAGVAVLAFALSPAPAALGDAWDDFRDPEGLDANDGSRGEQLVDLSSRGRYQLWGTSVDAFETEPVTGIGAGNFEFFWAENKTFEVFARDGHSLYLETLGELGVVGLLLLGSFMVVGFAVPLRRILSGDPEHRTALAGILAAMAVFAAAAAFDWVWELGAMGCVFVLLTALGLSASRRAESPAAADSAPGGLLRLGMAAAAALGILAVLIPLAGATAVEQSRRTAGEGRLPAALEQASDAAALQPYAATPQLQRALILEELGEIEPALAAAQRAVDNEPGNWQNWLTLSRLQARAGNADQAVRAYREARSLNPMSELFE